jgi:hypothetical protein
VLVCGGDVFTNIDVNTRMIAEDQLAALRLSRD